jgi:hypothetical protein
MPSDKSRQSPEDKQDSDHNVEIITPLKVGSPGDERDSSRPGRTARMSVLFLIIILAAIAAGGFFIIRHVSIHPVDLTDKNNQPVQPDMDVPFNDQKKIEAEQGVAPAVWAAEKENAEKELANFLKLKKEIEKRGAARWGGEQYEEMINLSQEADTLFMENVFPASAEKYVRAGRKAAELSDNTDAMYERMLQEGQEALQRGDSNTAREKFRTALMIEPSSETAQRYMERAENLDSVKRLIDSGRNHENENRPAFALADYQEALKLDPESREAREGLNRVKDGISDEQFQKLISDGLTAYHRGDYKLARTRLLKAKSFRQESREVRNALMQVDEAIQLDKIEKLRQQAMTAEQKEDWEKALTSYLSVLKLDPHISFASEGKERSLDQIRLAKRITYFLQKPDALESDQQLQHAVLVIEEAEQLQPRGPRLTAQLDELKALVDSARTPVKVIIDSDNLTEIAVYKVGKLGRFVTHQLSLRPGTYTVVGSRDGYKDVRQQIIVKAGQRVLRVTIICRNKV